MDNSSPSLVHDGHRDLLAGDRGLARGGPARRRCLFLHGLPVGDVGLDAGAHVVRQRVHPLRHVRSGPVLQQGQRQVQILRRTRVIVSCGSRLSGLVVMIGQTNKVTMSLYVYVRAINSLTGQI